MATEASTATRTGARCGLAGVAAESLVVALLREVAVRATDGAGTVQTDKVRHECATRLHSFPPRVA